MKRLNIIPALIGLTTVPTVITTISACANSAIPLDFSMMNDQFCCSGGFEKGSTYKFTIDLANWTDGKPSEKEWASVKFQLTISSNTPSQENFIDWALASFTIDGTTSGPQQSQSIDNVVTYTFTEGKITSASSKIIYTVKCTDTFEGKLVFKKA